MDTLDLIGAAGLAIIASTGRVMAPARAMLRRHSKCLGQLVGCSMCIGFWVGVVWGVLVLGADGRVVLWGGAVSLVSYAADQAIGAMEKQTHSTKRGEGEDDQ